MAQSRAIIAERRRTPHWKASKRIFEVSHKETSKGKELGSQHVTGPYGVRIGERCMAMAVPRSHCSQARTGLAKEFGGVEVEVAWIQKIQGAGGVGRQPPPLVENQAGAQMVGRGGAAGGRIICGGHWTVSRTAAFVKFSRAAFAVLSAWFVLLLCSEFCRVLLIFSFYR